MNSQDAHDDMSIDGGGRNTTEAYANNHSHCHSLAWVANNKEAG
jgi:hypothetical protein